MTQDVCRIKRCGEPIYKTGLCKKHLLLEVKKRSKTSISRNNACRTHSDVCWEFVKWAESQDTDECIIWPFSINSEGYAVVNQKVDGERQRLSVRLEILSRIEKKPSPAHSCWGLCGNRNCINPKHFYWGTRSEEALKQWQKGNIGKKKKKRRKRKPKV